MIYSSRDYDLSMTTNMRRHCSNLQGVLESLSLASVSVVTLLSSGSGLLKDTYSVPTHDTIPKPLGLTPAAGVSVSSLSFSTAYIAKFSWFRVEEHRWAGT